MKRRLLAAALLLFPLYSFAAAAAPSAVEYCTEDPSIPLHQLIHWDCSGIKAGSIKAIENQAAQTHEGPSDVNGFPGKYYLAKDSHDSFWVFLDDSRAVRYRRLMKDDRYIGVGLTVFCSETKRSCESFRATVAKDVPSFMLFAVGPPLPQEPPIVR